MAATKLKLLAITCIFLLFYIIACTVDNSASSPGAFVCNPTTTDVTLYQSQVFATLTLYNCTTCHGSGAQGQQYRTRFKLQTVTASLQDQKNNLCTTYLFGQLSPSRAIVFHPQDSKHTGGRFSSTELKNIIDWVGTYRLP